MLHTIFLYLHIAGGTMALLSGPFAMLNQDGGKVHRISGKIFYYAMLMVSFSGLYLSWYRSNLFLLLIAVFSFYLVSMGRRALQHKKLHRGTKAEIIDWVILIISGAFGIFQIAVGAYSLVRHNSFGLVSIVFGAILCRRVQSDVKWLRKYNGEPKTWLYVHIGNMIGSYIAAFTAFLVQNVHTDPAFISWLAPTVVLTPFIFVTINKFKKGKKLKAMEEVNA